MDYMDVIFVRLMESLGLVVGDSCSGARTFIECMVVAALCCIFDRAFSIRIFIVAALSAVVCNFVRCFILLTWLDHGWNHYAWAHDFGGLALVAIAFFVIIHVPRRLKS